MFGLLSRATLVGVLLLLVLGRVAFADPYEPNDTQDRATGPVAGDTVYEASIDTVNDVDWYALYALGGQQSRFTASWGAQCSGVTAASPKLLDAGGRIVADIVPGFTLTTPYG